LRWGSAYFLEVVDEFCAARNRLQIPAFLAIFHFESAFLLLETRASNSDPWTIGKKIAFRVARTRHIAPPAASREDSIAAWMNRAEHVRQLA
jgi:hypothetical protein